MNDNDILLAADILFKHRLNKTGLKSLPSKLIPSNIEEAYKNKVYYIEGVGTAITIIPETEIRTFGTWAQEIGAIWDEDGTEGFDTTGWDNSTGQLVPVDYWTINRASRDRNAWSRSNRWFHKDVIALSNKRNNYAFPLTENQRAKRPIVEFEAGLNLFNHGILR